MSWEDGHPGDAGSRQDDIDDIVTAPDGSRWTYGLGDNEVLQWIPGMDRFWERQSAELLELWPHVAAEVEARRPRDAVIDQSISDDPLGDMHSNLHEALSEISGEPLTDAPAQRRRGSPYVNVGDEMTWPHPSDPNHTEWALRYGTPTREDLMYAASVMAAYKQLVSDTWEKRRRVLPVLKAAQQTYIPED